MKARNYSLRQRINRTEAVYHALGEAAYEGNIGAVEVAQFYMNADDNQIQEFETELDNGNETEAWDIVQRFHGVDLVGIGSDQPSPRAERVAGQIDEYFNKKNNKKALTYELLYEMVRDVLLEGREPPEPVQKFIKFLKDNGYANAKFAGTVNAGKDTESFQVTNLGSKDLRLKITELLDEAGVSWARPDRDVYSADKYQHPYRFIQVNGVVYELIQGDFKGTATGVEPCKIMDSTAFEGNLVYGLLYVSSGKAAANQFLEQVRGQKQGIVCLDDALKLGVAVAKAILSDVQQGGLNPAAVERMSGGRAKGELTEVYKRHGAVSKESKADIIIGDIGVSVKKKEASQFMSPQAPEMAAIMDVAMSTIATSQNAKLEGEIESFIGGLQRAMGSEAKKHAPSRDEPGELKKDQGNWYRNKEKMAASTGTGDTTLYGKFLTRAIRLHGDDLSGEERAKLARTLADTTAEGFLELRDSVAEVLNDPGFKSAVVKEGFTGNGKFTSEEQKAKSLLTWSTANPSDSYFTPLYVNGQWNDAWFDKVSPRAKIDIRERGNTAKRGGAARSELPKGLDKKGGVSESLLPSVLEEIFQEGFSEEEEIKIQERSEQIYSQFESGQVMLDEGLWDFAKNLGSKAKEAITALWRKISGFLAKVGQYLKKLLDRGFSFFVELLGLEVSMEVEIKF